MTTFAVTRDCFREVHTDSYIITLIHDIYSFHHNFHQDSRHRLPNNQSVTFNTYTNPFTSTFFNLNMEKCLTKVLNEAETAMSHHVKFTVIVGMKEY